MSAYIPQTKRAHRPKYIYLANVKTGEVFRVKIFEYEKIRQLMDQGYGVTSKEIYQRFLGSKYRGGANALKNSFNPVEYPTGSRKFIHANILYSI